MVVVAEGLAVHNPDLDLPSGNDTEEHRHDRLNLHTGKAAPYIAALVHARLGLRCHFAVSDYLQRSARHIASSVDVESAWRVGVAAVEMALRGEHLVMPGLLRRSTARTTDWDIVAQPLRRIAGRERAMPSAFIRRDGFGITPACREYLLPLIQGEDYPTYKNGLPRHVCLKKIKAEKKLPAFDAGIA